MSAIGVTILASVLGLVIAAACISIPQLVRIRSQRPDDGGRAYYNETGRSAQDIERDNAALLLQQGNAARAEREGGAGGSPADATRDHTERAGAEPE